MPEKHVAAALGLFLLSPCALALQAGEVIWSADLARSPVVSEPTVGPDGSIYVHAGAFHAIAPDGTIRWSLPLAGPSVSDVSADGGVVFAGSGRTVQALDAADGSLVWSFTEPSGGQGIMAGPTLGPDGNVYVITDCGGLGAFSLAPDGVLRWNVPGFCNLAGTGLSRIPFSGGRLFFAEDVVPGCDPDGLQQGLVALTTEGDVDWCVPLSATTRPVTAPGGRVYERFSSSVLRAYEPDGAVAWTFPLPPPSSAVVGPGVGPDGAAYLARNRSEVWSFAPDGVVRWTVADPTGGYHVRPSVAPDDRAVVVGKTSAPGENGSVLALAPADGSLLWVLALEGDAAGAAAPAAFSTDGSVAYVPVNTATTSRLLAIRVGPAGDPPRQRHPRPRFVR